MYTSRARAKSTPHYTLGFLKSWESRYGKCRPLRPQIVVVLGPPSADFTRAIFRRSFPIQTQWSNGGVNLQVQPSPSIIFAKLRNYSPRVPSRPASFLPPRSGGRRGRTRATGGAVGAGGGRPVSSAGGPR